MKAVVLSILMAFGMGVSLGHADSTNATTSTAAQITALRKQVDDAYSAYSTNDTSGKLWDAYYYLNDANLPKIFELAKRDPASEASFEAFAWIVTNPSLSPRSQPLASQSLEFLVDFHTTNPNISEICRTLGSLLSWDPTDKTAQKFLSAASENNPNRNARGYATLALGQMLKGEVDWLDYFQAKAPPLTNQWWLQLNAANQEAAKSGGVNGLSAEAEQAFNTVLTKYADVSAQSRRVIRQPKSTLSAEAKEKLYELNHLMPGKVAPEISGEDVDGRALRLSQYRGKVVVLSFWASWCGPCMQLVPLECSLAEKFQGQPFAMLGVNGDDTRDAAKRAMQEEHMNWRSFWNEGGPNGAIPQQWMVYAWPTVYLLDPAGVIRLRFVGYMDSNLLESTVERLLEKSQVRKP